MFVLQINSQITNSNLVSLRWRCSSWKQNKIHSEQRNSKFSEKLETIYWRVSKKHFFFPIWFFSRMLPIWKVTTAAVRKLTSRATNHWKGFERKLTSKKVHVNSCCKNCTKHCCIFCRKISFFCWLRCCKWLWSFCDIPFAEKTVANCRKTQKKRGFPANQKFFFVGNCASEFFTWCEIDRRGDCSFYQEFQSHCSGFRKEGTGRIDQIHRKKCIELPSFDDEGVQLRPL